MGAPAGEGWHCSPWRSCPGLAEKALAEKVFGNSAYLREAAPSAAVAAVHEQAALLRVRAGACW